eukprot:CAMPEP_0119304834 /NCGR_PEP_ID=MMETSP1333-20130426/5959_1 /TAXON_ID=418940 /ORGANISM="Scyphosphaera apsteinii, Strain RCC1455" /LENGTH=175 /DNA_ID=CAMNT_0007307781 /DNA_START=22 /DNA_END=549 /DNA_ORIENTATION=-
MTSNGVRRDLASVPFQDFTPAERKVAYAEYNNYARTTDDLQVTSLRALLDSEELEHLHGQLCSVRLADLLEVLDRGRPVFIKHLAKLGVQKLADRQSFANALSRAHREGRIAESALLETPCELEKPVVLESLSVKELRRLIDAASLSSDDCVEKAQLVERAREAQARQQAHKPSS